MDRSPPIKNCTSHNSKSNRQYWRKVSHLNKFNGPQDNGREYSGPAKADTKRRQSSAQINLRNHTSTNGSVRMPQKQLAIRRMRSPWASRSRR